MSNTVKDVLKDAYFSFDKLNLLTSRKNVTKLFSKNDTFDNNDEERNKIICRRIIAIKLLFIITIAFCLFVANYYKILPDELFIGLALLTLFMPDVVLVITIIILIVNNKKIIDLVSSNNINNSETSESCILIDGLGDDDSEANKYILTTTPDIFTN